MVNLMRDFSTSKDIKPGNWIHLQELLFKDSYDPSISRHRSKYAFRGLADISYELETSLSRLKNRPVEMEKHLIRNFRKYSPINAVSEDKLWHWLALAQHHGLPTRLLDWTFSPYVALHFATEQVEKYDRDGAIWCVDYYGTRQGLPPLLKEEMDKHGFKGFSIEILNDLFDEMSKFEELGRDEGDFLLFFEPPSFDTRIINQFTLFSVMPDPMLKINDWLKANPDVFFRIIIPKELKWEIRDKLDQANITERTIYPGLDGLSKWLKRWYSKKDSAGDEKAEPGETEFF